MFSWMILSRCSSYHGVLIEVLTQEGPMIDDLVISRNFVFLISQYTDGKEKLGPPCFKIFHLRMSLASCCILSLVMFPIGPKARFVGFDIQTQVVSLLEIMLRVPVRPHDVP